MPYIPYIRYIPPCDDLTFFIFLSLGVWDMDVW